MSSKITDEKFDEIRLEKIKHHLESLIEKGKPRFYEIYVDNLKVVEKTDDLNQFDDYKIYVDGKTKMMKLLLYSSCESSPRNDKFFFTFQPDDDKKSLGEIEIKQKIDDAINEVKEQIKIQNLEKELLETQEELEEAHEYIEKLQDSIEKIRNAKIDDSRQIKFGQVATLAIEELIKRNPAILNNIPLIGSLSGILNEPKIDSGSTSTQGNATFQESKEEGLNATFANELTIMFSEQEFDKIVQLINLLYHDKTKINTVLELVNQ